MSNNQESILKTYLKVLVDDDLHWQQDAVCAQVDPEIFFPEDKRDSRMAKEICKTCPVRLDCLEYAVRNEEHMGVWGGLTAFERRKLRNRPVGRPRHERLAS